MTMVSAAVFESPVALAARVPHGAKLAVAHEDRGVSMAATRELVRRPVRDLHLVCVPVSGLQADVLIGAGCVATIETSAVTLTEYGLAPRFSDAVRSGAVRILDATCPAIHAGIQAAQKGQPFVPIRGLLETDVLARRPDWRIIDNPFKPGDPAGDHAVDMIVLVPAIVPDIALFHAPLADRHGNVFIGRKRELLNMAHAARATLVTVEAITDDDLLADENRAAGVIPAIYITAIAHAPRGAAPLRLWDYYAEDEVALARYALAARSTAGFNDWLGGWLNER